MILPILPEPWRTDADGEQHYSPMCMQAYGQQCWDAALNGVATQRRVNLELGDNIAKFTDCDCGCNNPVADTPIEMLEFLLHRLSQCGVGDAVAAIYARDIKSILDKQRV